MVRNSFQILETMHKRINTNLKKKAFTALSHPNSDVLPFKYMRILSINFNWCVIMKPLTSSASWGILELIGWSLDEKVTVSPCWQRPHFFARTDSHCSIETDSGVTFIWRWCGMTNESGGEDGAINVISVVSPIFLHQRSGEPVSYH